MGNVICTSSLDRWLEEPWYHSDITKMELRGFAVTGYFPREGYLYFTHMGPFVVDDISYPSRASGGYQGPMFSLKVEYDHNWGRCYEATRYNFRLAKLHPEWKDLEWDPTIRL